MKNSAQTPDAVLRRWIPWFLFGLLVLAVAGGWFILVQLQGAVQPDPEAMAARGGQRIRLLVTLVAAALAVPPVLIAGMMWRIGRQAVRTAQFPPPGIPAPVRMQGADARRRGRLLQGSALLLVAFAGLLVFGLRALSGLLGPG